MKHCNDWPKHQVTQNNNKRTHALLHMLFLISLVKCIEDIYDPGFGKDNVYYGYDKNGFVNEYRKENKEYGRDNWVREFENDLKESKEYDGVKENGEYDDLNDYDDYNNNNGMEENKFKNGFKPYGTPYTYNATPSAKNVLYNPLKPLALQQSFSRSILLTTKNSLPKILSKEFNDISQDLNRKLTNSIYNVRNSNIDHDKFRELIVIKKRVVSDGKHKVVNLDVSGRVVPRNGKEDKLRMFLAGMVFLLAGVVFTGSIKFYQNYLRIKKVDALGGLVN